MSRFLLPLLAALLIGGAADAQPGRKAAPARAAPVRPADWNNYVRQTPEGNFIVGNPAAPVKVVEYMSFTCPHCAAFAAESKAVLKGQFIKSGSVAIEYRPIGRDQVDLGATMLAKCAGTRGFAGAAEEIFARQGDWLGIAYRFMQDDAKRFALDTPLEQVRAGVQTAGLIDLMRARGLSDARINACFADQKSLNQVLRVGDKSRATVEATPTFFVNGVKQPLGGWAQLEPILRAKGAR